MFFVILVIHVSDDDDDCLKKASINLKITFLNMLSPSEQADLGRLIARHKN
jgi:hypothetical protein